MYRTQGIIIATEKLGETDQLVSIFSKDFGKLKVVAQGSLKHDSKMRSIVQVGHVIDCVILPLRSGRYRLTSPSIIEAFSDLRRNPQKLPTLLFSLGIFDRIVHEEERDQTLWDFLFNWLSQLEHAEFQKKDEGERVAQWFAAKLLGHLGGLDEAEIGHISNVYGSAQKTEVQALNWQYLQRSYHTALGFSLPRHFLVQ